jgi:uncharacterized phage-like protein YoqJ
MSKICCFTGHRDIKNEVAFPLTQKIEDVARNLIENEGVTDFRAGGARGFDNLASLVVLKLKREYPQIKLHLMIPYKGHSNRFYREDKSVMEFIIKNADTVTYVSEKYYNGVMFARNRALVNGADICVAYLNALRGGTSYTVNYARKARIEVINLHKELKK